MSTMTTVPVLSGAGSREELARFPMPLPYVYADFNAINAMEYQGKGRLAEMPLTGYGTLQSLANQKLRLAEDMPVVLYEPNDIEVNAVVHFDRTRIDPAGRVGEWVGRFDPEAIRESGRGEMDFDHHLCYGCRNDLKPFLRTVGQRYIEVCPTCGTSVMAPLAPPDDPS
jgi:hypothetical protein